MKLNGIDIPDYGLYLLTMPPVVKAQKRVRHIVIPGRSGHLTKWDGDYESYTKEPELYCSGSDLPTALEALRNATQIEFDNDAGFAYDVSADEIIEASVEGGKWYRIRARYTTQPLKRLATEEPIIGATVVLENAGNVPCKPRIEITATGTVTVNNITVTGVTGTLVIDNHLGLVYDGAGNAFNRMSGNLFEVATSLTIIGSAEMTVYPNQRWI